MKSIRLALAFFVLPAGVIALLPVTHHALVYDRAAILRGEIWRLWTGHWVHFSPSHLGWNLLVILFAGCWLEGLRPGSLFQLAAVAAPVLSLILLGGEPAMNIYGGLSGLATGAVVLLALTELAQPGSARWPWIGLLGLIGAKIGAEAIHQGPVFAGLDGTDIRLSLLAHAGGVAAAAVLFLTARDHLRATPVPALHPAHST